MLVSKTISIEVESLIQIKKLVEDGKYSNVSEFVQKAVQILINK